MTAVKSGIIFKSKLASIGIWPYIVRLHLFGKKNQCYCNPQSDHFLLIPTKKLFETTVSYGSYIMTLLSNACVGLDTTKSRWRQPALQNYAMRQRNYVTIWIVKLPCQLTCFQGTKHNCLQTHFPLSRSC